jgi:peptidoglycan/LPS O-acetylase OafA/YrhL
LIIWLPYILLKQYLFESGFGGISQLEQNNLASFISNVFLLNSMGLHQHLSWNPPAWSISTEFWAYIVFFFITAKVDKKESLIIPLIIGVGCYSFILSLGKPNLDITYEYGFFRCLGAFYIGVFIYRVSIYVEIPKSLKSNLSLIELLYIVSLVVFVSLAATSFIYFIPIIIIFSVSIIVFSQSESGIFGMALLSRHIRLLGTWSYSIYMTHAIFVAVIANFLEYVLKWDINTPLNIYSVILNVATLSVVIIISKYSYTFIEKPFRDKSRILAMRQQNH